jgi:hypothetical protein
MPEPEKVQCVSCGVTILATTAESYDGYCAPCYKKFNEKPPKAYLPPKPRLLDKILGFAIPIAIIVFFFLGIPLGYKLVLGGPNSSIKSGTTQNLYLIHEIPDVKLNGRPVRIVQRYIIVELESGRSLWIPEENVAGIEFAAR